MQTFICYWIYASHVCMYEVILVAYFGADKNEAHVNNKLSYSVCSASKCG